ncbi:MAG: type I CRISPR-associated protein Cas7 [Ignavibacteriales bacterium]|jgi:Family of unknown function (DUF694).|nr:MAG: CRISPR-associated protein [Ignavibacteriaceae bacterium]MBW7873776.1 type I CRISPR-associated protein Cas7 [Ignavibacteria bacterium]MCZ2143074.1 type I CRISPR-associated protein Cas7 [Ignavibacteriales bacterium]OQY70637.1 MAG: hypothetical protein B6D45_10925 [Ignavibacteriales bacterium UTCHB3]MBV6445753.1 hypothetical protein [Ignavibacteriaceae bacterium]
MTQKFENRVYGATVIRSVNSNFNADFTHAPRTLPDGVVYATDKAIKYAIKDYIRKNYEDPQNDNYVLYIKRLGDDLLPYSLDGAYNLMVKLLSGTYKKNVEIDSSKNKGLKDIDKKRILKGLTRKITVYNLLKCIDIRLFGATFAKRGSGSNKKSSESDKRDKTESLNLSVHGPVQISHAINRFPENTLYTEDILSPFRTEEKTSESSRTSTDENSESNLKSTDKQSSTIGNQTNLMEGHYVYHFTINPLNLEELYKQVLQESEHIEKLVPTVLSDNDISLFKEALNRSVTYLDSSRKIGSENEMSLFVTLKKGSLKILPNFSELIDVTRDSSKNVVINAEKVGKLLKAIEGEIEKIELFYNPADTIVEGFGELKVEKYNILNSEPVR